MKVKLSEIFTYDLDDEFEVENDVLNRLLSLSIIKINQNKEMSLNVDAAFAQCIKKIRNEIKCK